MALLTLIEEYLSMEAIPLKSLPLIILSLDFEIRRIAVSWSHINVLFRETFLLVSQ